MESSGIAGVVLDVRDLAGTAAFYREAIGLQPLEVGGDEMTLGAAGAGFLRLRHRPAAAARDPAAAGLFHVAFLLPTRADLGRWLDHAAATGVALDGAADHLVSEAVYLHDPEGNGIEIYADRARTEWPWRDGRLQMANDRLDFAGLRAAGAGEGWTGAPAGTAIGHVHLQVGEVAAARRFYAGELGLDVTVEWPQAVFLSSGGYHHHLAANTWHSLGAGPRTPGRTGLAEIVLRAEADGGTRADPWGTLIRVAGAGAPVFA